MKESYVLPSLQIAKLLGRRTVVDGLLRDLVQKETPDHISMVAPRYFGKTVLMNALAERFSAADSHYQVVINWDLRHDTPEDDRSFQVGLAKRLDKCLLALGMNSYHEYLQDTAGDIAGSISDVTESLASENVRILILLDDFDRLASQPLISKNLWDYLRSLAQKDNLRFVLSSRRRLRECIPNREGRTSDFWNIFTNVVTLKPLDSQDLDDFLAPLIEAGFRFDPTGRREFTEWTGGIPVLATCVCLAISQIDTRTKLEKSVVHSTCEGIIGEGWTQDALSLLWDDCEKEIQGDLLDIAENPAAARIIPSIRQSLLLNRGYIAKDGASHRVICVFMQRFAAGHEVRNRDLRDLFKNSETELRSLKTLLSLRLSAISGGHSDTRSYIEHAIDGLARGPKTALASIRSIAEEALNVAWEAECPGGVMPSPMQLQITKSWETGGGGVDHELLQRQGDKNVRRRILRLASGDQGRKRVTQKVSRPMVLLIDHLHNLGNFGQHLNEIPAAIEKPVDVSFCAAACWSSIELFRRMTMDLA